MFEIPKIIISIVGAAPDTSVASKRSRTGEGMCIIAVTSLKFESIS